MAAPTAHSTSQTNDGAKSPHETCATQPPSSPKTTTTGSGLPEGQGEGTPSFLQLHDAAEAQPFVFDAAPTSAAGGTNNDTTAAQIGDPMFEWGTGGLGDTVADASSTGINFLSGGGTAEGDNESKGFSGFFESDFTANTSSNSAGADLFSSTFGADSSTAIMNPAPAAHGSAEDGWGDEVTMVPPDPLAGTTTATATTSTTTTTIADQNNGVAAVQAISNPLNSTTVSSPAERPQKKVPGASSSPPKSVFTTPPTAARGAQQHHQAAVTMHTTTSSNPIIAQTPRTPATVNSKQQYQQQHHAPVHGGGVSLFKAVLPQASSNTAAASSNSTPATFKQMKEFTSASSELEQLLEQQNDDSAPEAGSSDQKSKSTKQKVGALLRSAKHRKERADESGCAIAHASAQTLRALGPQEALSKLLLEPNCGGSHSSMGRGNAPLTRLLPLLLHRMEEGLLEAESHLDTLDALGKKSDAMKAKRMQMMMMAGQLQNKSADGEEGTDDVEGDAAPQQEQQHLQPDQSNSHLPPCAPQSCGEGDDVPHSQ